MLMATSLFCLLEKLGLFKGLILIDFFLNQFYNLIRKSNDYKIIIVLLLLYLFTNLNPIYSAIISLFAGGIATVLCRPDLKNKILIGGLLFLIIYFIFFLFFNLLFPGWVEQIWNLSEISGILFLGIPIEEILFAFGVGMLWGGIYEHIKWYKLR